MTMMPWSWRSGQPALTPFGMQAGYPDVAVLPGRFDWAMLGTVIMTSFLGQVLLNRAFQISNASKASSINCVQVSHHDLTRHMLSRSLISCMPCPSAHCGCACKKVALVIVLGGWCTGMPNSAHSALPVSS